MLIVGRGEDDREASRQALRQLEPGHPRHVDVEKDHVGSEVAERGQGLGGIAGPADNLDPPRGAQESGEPRDREGLVVDQEGAKLTGHWISRDG